MARALVLVVVVTFFCALIYFRGAVAFSAAASFDSTTENVRTILLIPYSDPWKKAKPRWLDIDDRRYHDFINHIGTTQEFSYTKSRVVLSYNLQQTGVVFRGHIEAEGLKPNFAYQMKLCGKPSFGNRGWGAQGDDKTNDDIGYQGRWWDDTVQQGGWDDYYRSLYLKAPLSKRHSMVGYLFVGDFVTDEQGKASHDFACDRPLHITWQDKQITKLKHLPAGTFSVGSTAVPYLGYGGPQAMRTVKLWYEHEANRGLHVKLPAGKYNCRFLITEESFHSKISAGGHWLTVLATEDFANGLPDDRADNDVSFVMN